jgi:hypothetical protein
VCPWSDRNTFSPSSSQTHKEEEEEEEPLAVARLVKKKREEFAARHANQGGRVDQTSDNEPPEPLSLLFRSYRILNHNHIRLIKSSFFFSCHRTRTRPPPLTLTSWNVSFRLGVGGAPAKIRKRKKPKKVSSWWCGAFVKKKRKKKKLTGYNGRACTAAIFY